MGLGIGATTTVYSVVDRVVMRPLPYPDSDRLVAVGTTFPGREWAEDTPDLMRLAGTSGPNFRDMRDWARSFDLFGAIQRSSVLLPDAGEGSELVAAARVTPELFEALSVAPALGRIFLPEEFVEGAAPVMMVTWETWLRRYGGDPAIVGERIDQAGGSALIAGVLPAGFELPERLFPRDTEYLMPMDVHHPRYQERGGRNLTLFARLAPGVTVEQAREELTLLADRLADEFPDGNVYPDGSHFGAGANALQAHTVGRTGRVLRLFLAASGLLLLIAALNSATLMLARGLDRTRELEIRVALGAGRGRVVRTILAESLVLAVAGGALGVLIAFAGVDGFRAFSPPTIPRLHELYVDGPILGVALLTAVGAGVVAGLAPALRLNRTLFRSDSSGMPSRSVAGGMGRLRAGMVTVQVGLAVLLLSAAGLLFNSFMALRANDPGFAPDNLMSLRVPMKRPGGDDGPAWMGWDAVLAEIGAVPGVESVAGGSNVPFQSPFWAPPVLLPNEPTDHRRTGVAGYAITPGYFRSLGASLSAGRDFAPSDGADDPGVMIVNRAFVDLHMAGLEPLGTVLRIRGDDGEVTPFQVVGIAENIVQTRSQEGMPPAIYVPYTQAEWPFVQAVIRTGGPPTALIPDLRSAVAEYSGIVPPQDVRTMEDRMGASWVEPRFRSVLLGAFAAVALLLAGAGLYGTLAHAIRGRERELGIRMALGADRGQVLAMVVRGGMGLTLGGVGLGLVGSLALSRVLEGFLYSIRPSDPATLLGVALLMVFTGGTACWFPARRATRADPVEALRAE
jgi:predicted permease